MESSSHSSGIEQLTTLDGAFNGEFPCAAELHARNFSDALISLERRLTESPDSLEAKLSWVLCQLELNLVPVAALTAPLEELFPKLKDRPEFDRVTVACLVRLGLKLVEKGQQRIAVLSFERALELARRSESYSPEALEALRSQLVVSIEDELKKPDSRREARQNRTLLEEKLKHVRAIVIEHKPAAKLEPAPFALKKKPLNSKTLLETAFEEAPPTNGALSAERTVSMPGEPQTENLFESLMPDTKSSRTNLAIIGVFVFVLALGILTAYTMLYGSLGAGDMQLAMASPFPEHPDVSLPELQPVESVSLGGQSGPALPDLDKVKERLSNLSIKPIPAEPEKKAEPPKEPDPAYYDPPARIPQSSSSAPPVKEDNKDPRKLPALDPSQLGGIRVQDMGSQGRRAPSGSSGGPAVNVGPDGRPYGPPLQTGENSVALDGSKLQGYPVDQLAKPVLYRTITATKVLEAPSVLARPVDQLNVNAKVQVVSRMGKWLELRSTGGKRGYIYAQDAVEIKE